MSATAARKLATIDVWYTRLSAPVAVVRARLGWLDAEEQARAARFHFERDRARFILRRAWLRAVLGDTLKLDPARIRFRHNAYGKPTLDLAACAEAADCRASLPCVDFNASHSHDLALVVVRRAGAAMVVPPSDKSDDHACAGLGVDLERLDPERADPRVAAHYFTAAEQADLAALAPDRWIPGFFRCWTSKEAYVKARGLGLSLSLDRFDVRVDPDVPAALLADRLVEHRHAPLFLRALEAPPGFTAVLAAPNPEPEAEPQVRYARFCS